MDEFHFGNVKAEKAIAMSRYNLLAAISKTLRILELCVALIFLSWVLTRLPCAFRISAEYLHKLAAFAATPLFVFALSNAIIAALLAQRSAAANADTSDAASDELYEEFLKNRSAVTDQTKPPPSDAAAPPHAAATEAEYEDKKVVSETSAAAVDRTAGDSDVGRDRGLPEYRRSQSEKWKGEEGGKTMLRRSETEKVREDRREDDDLLYPQDKLSSEEFQRTIEAFIAKQMRFLREESSAIVVQNPS